MRITKISFKNFMGYKTLNLPQAESEEFPEGLILISGRNSHGKSTIIEGILFALFFGIKKGEQIFKGRTAESLITYGQSKAEILIYFELDNTNYYINRRWGKSGPVPLKLFEQDKKSGIYREIKDIDIEEFFEISKENRDLIARKAYLHASLLLSISSLEAFVNGIAIDFKNVSGLSLHEKAFLEEKQIMLKNGDFLITNQLKMSRLTDRIEFLFIKFNKALLNKRSKWWQNLKAGIALRNNMVHPKEYHDIKDQQIEATLLAVIECINNLFRAIYKKKLPSFSMGLNSKFNF